MENITACEPENASMCRRIESSKWLRYGPDNLAPTCFLNWFLLIWIIFNGPIVALWRHMATYTWVNIDSDNGLLPDQCWFVAKCVLWLSPYSNFHQKSVTCIRRIYFKITSKLPRVQLLKIQTLDNSIFGQRGITPWPVILTTTSPGTSRIKISRQRKQNAITMWKWCWRSFGIKIILTVIHYMSVRKPHGNKIVVKKFQLLAWRLPAHGHYLPEHMLTDHQCVPVAFAWKQFHGKCAW